MKTRIDILLPIGRFVMGSLYEPKTTDAEGNPLVIKTGPRMGESRVDYHIAVAIPKNSEQHWAQTEWGQQIWNFGHAAFPNGPASSNRFAWKIVDGDSAEPNSKGRKPVDTEGHAGHWILHFNGSIAPRIYRNDGAQVWAEPNAINLGDYIQVFGNISSNNSQQQPGIYLNHSMINFSGYGERITRGPDPVAVGFGGTLPVGASATPINSGFNPMPTPVATMPVAIPQAVTPYPEILTPPTVPVAPAPVPPPAAPVHIMLPAAGGITYEQYRAAGWTDEQLIQNGKMQA